MNVTLEDAGCHESEKQIPLGAGKRVKKRVFSPSLENCYVCHISTGTAGRLILVVESCTWLDRMQSPVPKVLHDSVWAKQKTYRAWLKGP